jgi:O-antigen/teichoic acid export membrane protein
MSNIENRQRLAKNTALLYFRMILIIIVSLFTVRVVLNILGVEDYGIYNVVGGVVTMFSFLSATMASASQRFFAFEIGRRDLTKLKQIFNLSFIIYIIISIVILLFAETIGLWFLNNKMVIPAERIVATNWIYQFAILSFLVTILTLPYNSSIIAHEDMRIYAFVSILEVVLKLGIVYLLFFFQKDKLIIYGGLLLFTTIIVSLTYRAICIKKYIECSFSFYWNKTIFKEMISYAGWNMVGAIANIFKNQGINILLNLFFGPIVNAARGVAFQVNSALNSFVTNIYMAVRPQITKAYASGEKAYMMQLVFQSAKMSYFLLLLLSMPVLLETNYILTLWLKIVPDYVVLFTRLLIINILIESMNNQLVAALQAVGKIKYYQAIVSTMLLLNLPISYLLLRLGYGPEVCLYISIAITIICFIPQIWIAHATTGMSIKSYFQQVIWIMFIVTIISSIIPYLFFSNIDYGLSRFLLVGFSWVISSLITIYYFGLTKNERIMVINILKTKLLKKIHY